MSVSRVKVDSTIFLGQKVDCGSALSLINVKIRLFNVSFISNVHTNNNTTILKSSYYPKFIAKNVPTGGAITTIGTEMLSINTLFEENSAVVGGAMYCELKSNATMINNMFVGNYAKRVSSYNSESTSQSSVVYSANGCSLTIVNSSFYNNVGYGYGRVFTVVYSTIAIALSSFKTNCGGIILSNHSSVSLNGNWFSNNSAVQGGVVFAVNNATVLVNENYFMFNQAQKGGVIYADGNSTVLITSCSFEQNRANKSDGGVVYLTHANIIISYSNFTMNTAMLHHGGVVYCPENGTVNILGCRFINNMAFINGGAIATMLSTVDISMSDFINNTVTVHRSSGGAMYLTSTRGIISETLLKRNSAGLIGGGIYMSDSIIKLNSNDFNENKADLGGGIGGNLSMIGTSLIVVDCRFIYNYGGAMFFNNLIMETYNFLFITNNRPSKYGGVVYLVSSTVTFHSSLLFTNNFGSLLTYNSEVNFTGNCSFINGANNRSSDAFQGGGAISAYESNFFFHQKAVFEYNHAQNGGAIYALKSKLYVYNDMTIANNIASNGGGIYLYKTQLTISNIPHQTNLHFNCFQNIAQKGGGVYLEEESQIVVLKLEDYQFPHIIFIHNIANYGGGVFVDDSKTSACAFGAVSETSNIFTEVTNKGCFLQYRTEKNGFERSVNNHHNNIAINVSLNYAEKSGRNIYGGFLERCIINRYFDDVDGVLDIQHQGLKFFTSYIPVITISSDPIGLCFCENGKPNCANQIPRILVRKGNEFKVSLVAVDQVNNTKSYVAVQSYLNSSVGGFAIGQQTQIVTGNCTDLVFNVYSPHSSEELILYANGPCMDAKPSQRRLNILFLPCVCGIGFQLGVTTQSTICECECDPKLLSYINSCDPKTDSLEREGEFWISLKKSSYLIFPHCPLDYCTQRNLMLNLNIPNGSDVQCINNRSGKLCGSCQPGLSLSISSSKCIPCPRYWPAVCAIVVIGSAFVGIALVTLLLVCNLTVAAGTLNGLIFYANILDANRATFLLNQFSRPNFVTVIIAWMNLELGFDLCFFKGLDSYWKTWLQLGFPVYVILLVMSIIFISERSLKFSHLISKRNPVATLDTLILFSYTKILRTVIAVLSFAISDDSSEVVWLTDASVEFLKGKHIPLFVTALFILVIGSMYTAVLFSWQWLLYHQDKIIFRFVKNQKLRLFLEPYHAPYTCRHRYWTGLLLLVRVILYLFTVSVSTVVREPFRWNLLMIFIAMMCILLPKIMLGIKIYKNRLLDILEVISYLNLILFCVAKLFTKVEGDENNVITYISGTIFFILLLAVLMYHFFTELCFKMHVWKKLTHRNQREYHIIHENERSSHEQSQPTFSVVEGPPPISAFMGNRQSAGLENENWKSESAEDLLLPTPEKSSIELESISEPTLEHSSIPYHEMTH